MQSLKYAFRFIDASFSLAIEKPILQKPWLHLGLGSLGILIIWFLPLGLVVGLIGLRPAGLILIGLIIIIVIFSLVIWGQITALKTSQIFVNIIQAPEDHSEVNSEKSVIITHWFDVVLFAMTLPAMRFMQSFRKMFKSEEYNPWDWLDAHYLVLPVINLEDLTLNEALERVNLFIDHHMLRFRSGLIKVALIAKWVQGLLIAAGFVLGFIVAVYIADPINADSWQRVLGTGVGVIWGGLFTVMGVLFSTYTRTCYHTALYLWVRNVETARQNGESDKASAPEILSRVLGMPLPSKKEP